MHNHDRNNHNDNNDATHNNSNSNINSNTQQQHVRGVDQARRPKQQSSWRSGTTQQHTIHQTIMRTSSSTMIQGVQGSNTLIKSGVGVDSVALVATLFHVPYHFLDNLDPIHKKMMPNSVNSRKELRMVLLEQVGFQKRFLKYPQFSRASSGKPESRLSIPLELGIIKGWLGTWDAPDLFAVSGS